jgi:hypothetical protein
MRFHHVQLFVSAMKPMHEYKALEARLNKLAGMGHFDPFSGGMRFLEEHAHQARVQEGARVWETISCQRAPAFVSAGQDLVEQLIVGLGWRITAEVRGPSTARASLCRSLYRRCVQRAPLARCNPRLSPRCRPAADDAFAARARPFLRDSRGAMRAIDQTLSAGRVCSMRASARGPC